MQNREGLSRKGHDRKRRVTRGRGRKFHFRTGGGGYNIVLRPKYRPLKGRIIKDEGKG
jgi:hypothetical protein